MNQLGLLDDEASGDDYREGFSFVDDKPKTVLVLPSPPQELTKQVDEFGNALIAWEQRHHGVFYQLQYFNQVTTQWEDVYSGNKTHYLATNLSPTNNQFRVSACMEEGCGNFSAVIVAEASDVEVSQCLPFEIDESFQ